jgi:asparagine synthase (glutamine-hydrolysing)
MIICRYVLLCDPDDVARAGRAMRILDHGRVPYRIALPGADLFLERAEDCLTLPGGVGHIIGPLFSRHGPARRLRPSDSEDLAAIARGGVSVLTRRYWGAYLAILTDGPALTIAREPLGTMACYYVQEGRSIMATSDVPLLTACRLFRPRISWANVAYRLSAPDLPVGTTALCGMDELLAGMALTASPGAVSVRPVWSPWDHKGPTGETDQTAMAAQVARRVDQSVRSWASCATDRLLLASGGLDSSVVGTALAAAGAPFSCLTMTTADPLGDERLYARALAEQAGAPLFERAYETEDIDFDTSVSAHFPKFFGMAHELTLHKAMRDQAQILGVGSIWSGNGGDNVFYNTASVRPLIDRILVEGWGWALLDTARDVASVTQSSLRQVADAALRAWGRRHRPYAWARTLTFLAPELAHELTKNAISHPWLDAPSTALPGKRGHVALLLRMQNHIEGYLRGAGLDIINPLIAQPIVEQALGIPSWLAIAGGRDRAVVRRAFAERLPGLIAERRRKGSPSGFAADLVDRRADEIKARLIDGRLAARNYLDRGALAEALRPGQAKALAYPRLLFLLNAEAWINHWQAEADGFGTRPPS